MAELLHQLITQRAAVAASDTALQFKMQTLSYGELADAVSQFSTQLRQLQLRPNDRVGIYLPKQVETVAAIFGTAHAGGVFVPVNPLLKPAQVSYILRDCNVRVLVTSSQRLATLIDSLAECSDLHSVILVDGEPPSASESHYQIYPWQRETLAEVQPAASRIDMDMAAILYTSGSTGNPKGVVLSHRNMLCGARSVSQYLANTSGDRLLAVLPFSFDYGLSQLTTAFAVGASVVLMDFLLARDVVRAVERYQITGLAAVPPLWNQLAELEWPDATKSTLRYITNSGGAMPKATTAKLQQQLPNTAVFLMYGLTEAFRSTYLPPDQVNLRPDSMGKAIPNAEIMVVRDDGSECEPGEPGELVHRGSLVAMGYWNDPAKTAERFKPCPGQFDELPLQEIAVWSGDQVRKDQEGYLYFISRKDEMIKTSGYRVSPTEVEEVIYSMPGVKEVAAVGLPHPQLGQAILLLVVIDGSSQEDIAKQCQQQLPNFMVPQKVLITDSLPRNPNGKIDRKSLSVQYANLFSPE